MNKFIQDFDENIRHQKKSQTSKTSKSVKHSTHKHEYEKVIVCELVGCYAWGGRCRLCGKFQSHYGQFSSTRYADFCMPRTPEQRGISFLSSEEIRAKFPDIPIYEFSYENMQYHLVP